jgi:beta-aspartyl-peptidase (threonine type)
MWCNNQYKGYKNPISGAKAVMQKSKFVFLSGHGADRFAAENGVEIVDNSYFFEQYMGSASKDKRLLKDPAR